MPSEEPDAELALLTLRSGPEPKVSVHFFSPHNCFQWNL